MQHNVTDTVLAAFSLARAGPPVAAPFGFSVVPLHAERGRSHRGDGLAPIAWREVLPAHPAVLSARNASASSVVLNVGTVLIGGMSARVVRARCVVQAGSQAVVPVTPLEARWWDAGALWSVAGNPVLTALVLQAALSADAAASSARNLLCSGALCEAALNSAVTARGDTAGWVLYAGGSVVAAFWPRSGAADPAGSQAMDSARGRGLRAQDSLREGVSRGELLAHVIDGALVLLPQGFALVDRLAASQIG
jgi:hypothetical protein